jgi:aldose 1-epimerase
MHLPASPIAILTLTKLSDSFDLKCNIAPSLGASVCGLWADGLPIFQPYDPNRLAINAAGELLLPPPAGCYPLVPFSNRIGEASFNWKGATYTLAKNFPPEPHAIHGAAWSRPWLVLEQQESSVLLRYQHQPNGAWPFAFQVDQRISLNESGAVFSFDFTNLAAFEAPVGLGWHPFFPKIKSTHLSFKAAQRWEMGGNNLPTHALDSKGLVTNCHEFSVDHCFSQVQGAVLLEDSERRISLRSELQHLVVFTRPDLASIAIEPVSHVSDALNLSQAVDQPRQKLETLGMKVLQPGGSTQASFEISIELKRR